MRVFWWVVLVLMLGVVCINWLYWTRVHTSGLATYHIESNQLILTTKNFDIRVDVETPDVTDPRLLPAAHALLGMYVFLSGTLDMRLPERRLGFSMDVDAHPKLWFYALTQEFLGGYANLALTAGLTEYLWDLFIRKHYAFGMSILAKAPQDVLLYPFDLTQFLIQNPLKHKTIYTWNLELFYMSYEANMLVSLHEMLERPERYFATENQDSPFYQLALVPSIYLMGRDMAKRFGLGTVLEFAENPYDEVLWQKSVGETLLSMEKRLLESAQRARKTPVYPQTEKVQQLNAIIGAYAPVSKQTLFQN